MLFNSRAAYLSLAGVLLLIATRCSPIAQSIPKGRSAGAHSDESTSSLSLPERPSTPGQQQMSNSFSSITQEITVEEFWVDAARYRPSPLSQLPSAVDIDLDSNQLDELVLSRSSAVFRLNPAQTVSAARVVVRLDLSDSQIERLKIRELRIALEPDEEATGNYILSVAGEDEAALLSAFAKVEGIRVSIVGASKEPLAPLPPESPTED